jgi:hypothetical protein
MIYKDSKGKSAIITRLKDKVAVYWGLVLKWAQARSCYGTGVWLPEKPWLDTDTWKNNK